MKKTLNSLSLNIPHDIYMHLPPEPRRVYLLLHGYLLDGEFMFTKLKDSLPKDCAIIAPNGPFIVPVKKHHKFMAKFSWYFFDPNTSQYYTHLEHAVDYIQQILKELKLEKVQTTVIGYSQGGYLAPKVAELVTSVDTVIGIACKFRNNKFEFRQSTMLHQINCEHDKIVDFPEAKDEFEKLRLRGNLGQFITLQNTGHRLDKEYISEVEKML